MKTLYICAISFFLAMPCMAQKNVIKERDSLMHLLPLAKHDTVKIKLLERIAVTWNSQNMDKAQQYHDQAMSIAKRLNDRQIIANVMIGIGNSYSQTGQSARAIQILQEAIKLSDPKKSRFAIPFSQEFIALAYQSQGDYENALKYALLCYDFCEAEYQKHGNNGDGSPNSTMEGVTGSNMTLGAIYLDLGKLDSAKYHLDRAYQLLKATKNNNRYFTFYIPKLLAKIYLTKQQPKQAKPYLDDASQKAVMYGDTAGFALVWTEIATYYAQINKPDSAVIFAQKAVEVGMKVRRYDAVMESSKWIKNYFEQKNNAAKALYYSNVVLAVQDSLGSLEKVKQSQRLLYEELQNQQAIAQLEADNQNRLIRYGLGAGVLLLLLLAAILWLNFDRKKRENKNLDTKIKLQETEFAHKLAETEMTALRAQMNPHFIFNCLNSIKLYTLENDNLKATEYMTKFSRLIRLVLENSRSERITLANELETLQLYMDMEAMRFKDKVAYQINVAEEVDTHYIEIPPLLIQPYIENAIWHGLMHKEGGGLITISVTTLYVETRHALSLPTPILQITITDNGIGRKAAAELKSKSATSNKSFGLKMTSERIELINQLYQTQTEVTIEDLDVGTKVTIEIPI
ncbi:MAG: histidine kinase [Spirosomataceae bacterium]